MIVIEKGIPVPAGRTYQRYPFSRMEIGDSFLGGKSAKAAMYKAQSSLGLKFTTRVQDGKSGTVRIWRIA